MSWFEIFVVLSLIILWFSFSSLYGQCVSDFVDLDRRFRNLEKDEKAKWWDEVKRK